MFYLTTNLMKNDIKTTSDLLNVHIDEMIKFYQNAESEANVLKEENEKLKSQNQLLKCENKQLNDEVVRLKAKLNLTETPTTGKKERRTTVNRTPTRQTSANQTPVGKTPAGKSEQTTIVVGTPDCVSRRRKSRPSDDPTEPSSAFELFARDESVKIRKSKPHLNVFNQYMEELYQRWCQLPEDGKKKYQAWADQDEQRYKQECKRLRKSET